MSLVKFIREEVTLIKDRDPAIKSSWEVLLYPGFRAVLSYHLAHRWYMNKHYFMARFLSQRSARKTGIEIHPGAIIGKGLFIDHGNGVVIGETTLLGDNVTLYQGVTLGGTGKETGKRHPTIGNNVMISAGAKILGSVTIGDNTKIGAGSVVLKQIPPNSTVVGVPGRVVKRNNMRIPQEDMDQVHLPDPILDDISMLKEKNRYLQQKLEEIEAKLNKIEDNHYERGESENDLEFRDNVCCIFEEISKTAS
jgi:serine O-acetyltransferase